MKVECLNIQTNMADEIHDTYIFIRRSDTQGQLYVYSSKIIRFKNHINRESEGEGVLKKTSKYIIKNKICMIKILMYEIYEMKLVSHHRANLIDHQHSVMMWNVSRIIFK